MRIASTISALSGIGTILYTHTSLGGIWERMAWEVGRTQKPDAHTEGENKLPQFCIHL